MLVRRDVEGVREIKGVGDESRLWCEWKGLWGKMALCIAYGPCGRDAERSVGERRRRFFEKLQEEVEMMKSEMEVMVVGDLNVHVGMGDGNDVIGEFGLGKCCSGGWKLKRLCESSGMLVLNGRQQGEGCTWRRGDESGQEGVIDYMVVSSRLFERCCDFKVCWEGGVATDHALLSVNLMAGRGGMRRKKESEWWRWRVERLRERQVRERFEKEMVRRLQQWQRLVRKKGWGVEACWDGFKKAVTGAAGMVIGSVKVKKQRSVPWLDAEVKQAMREKREMYEGWKESRVRRDWMK